MLLRIELRLFSFPSARRYAKMMFIIFFLCTYRSSRASAPGACSVRRAFDHMLHVFSIERTWPTTFRLLQGFEVDWRSASLVSLRAVLRQSVTLPPLRQSTNLHLHVRMCWVLL